VKVKKMPDQFRCLTFAQECWPALAAIQRGYAAFEKVYRAKGTSRLIT
jgi:hypothetical protein